MSNDKLRDELTARVKEFWNGFQSGDSRACLDVYAKNSSFFRSDEGKFDLNFTDELAKHFGVWTSEHKVHGFHIHEPHAVSITDKVAILTYKQNFDSQLKGKPQKTEGAVTSVFVNEGGTWRIVHTHESC